MAAVSLATLRTRVRERADMVGSAFVSDSATSLDAWINEAHQRLHGLLVDALGEEYISSSSSLTTVAGLSDYSLPADFYKLYGVDLNFNGSVWSLEPFQRAERNLFRNALSGGIPSYSLVGGTLRLYPPPSGGMSGSIIYAPSATTLVNGTDEVNYPNGWERFIVVDAAMQALLKEEADVSGLSRERDLIAREIEGTKDSRNLAAPHRITEVDVLDSDFPRGMVALVDSEPGVMTSGDITLYVNASTGNDLYDGRSINTPLLTIQAAIEKVPHIVNHNVSISVAAGTYANVDLSNFSISSSKLFSITGAMQAPTLTTGTTTGTITSVTAASGLTMQTFTDSGQSWTANNLRGKFVSFNGSTTYRLITGNTSTAATLTSTGTVSIGMTYQILDPASIIAVTSGTSPCVRLQGSLSRNTSVQISNFKLQATSTTTGGTALTCDGGGIFRALNCSMSSAGSNSTVSANTSSVTLSTCYITQTSTGTAVGISNCGTLNFGGSYFVMSGSSTLASVSINGANSIFMSGIVVEKLVNTSATLLNILSSTVVQAQVQGIVLLAPSGNTGKGLSCGESSLTQQGYVDMGTSLIAVRNCGIAIAAGSNGKFFTGGTTVDACTTAFQVSRGGTIRATGSTTITGTTNEIDVEGTFYTMANLAAAAPLQVLNNLQTFSKIMAF